jgi:hypothetical protein
MAVLIAVYDRSGADGKPKCIGRCDARCYNAINPGCDCICNGKNHGGGLKQAIENTAKEAEQWIERYIEKNDGLTPEQFVINEVLTQQLMLPMGV